MVTPHLLDNGEDLLMMLRGNGALEEGKQSVFVWFDPRRQP
jgi:hypothetical protein